MASDAPQEFISLESGSENNYAVIYHERLQNRFACNGPARAELYAEQGATNFTKVRLDLDTMKLVGDDFTFAQTRVGRDVAYGTAGDCYSVNPSKCRKGSFKVDLRGTRLRVRDDVTWSFQGFPNGLEIQDYSRLYDGTVITAKCGGWCGRCKPTRGAILVEPLCSLPAACPYPMDVVFALDSSYNVTRSEFEEQKSFVLTTISAFTISKSQTHVGVITVSETARKDVELTEYSDPDLLRARVSLLQPRKTPASSPTSRLRDMLRKALEIFKAGIRSGVPRSLIVVVFGDTTENLETFAASLTSRDIQIFVIAVGVNAPSPNHIALASEGTNVHTLNSVDDLKSLSARLAKDTCNDPCRERVCQKYSRCKAIDYINSECVCPKLSDCPPTRDEVCGSDGKTYGNDCELRVDACINGEETTVANLGPCGLCAGKKCKEHARCEVKDGEAKCVCKDVRECPQATTPVCGRDNNTYINRCFLDVANCLNNETTDEKKSGKCEPCASVKCKDPKTCDVDSQGNAKCVCPDELDCAPVVNTVCGSDGKTYLNDCVMKAKACEKDMDIYVVLDGYCGPCDLAKDCKNNTACIGNFDGSVTCKCRTQDECPKDGDGVCGSDGQTYINKCQLDATACANNKQIQQLHVGPCGSCNPNSCPDNQVCIGHKDGTSSCKCIERKDCPKERDLICGTDGRPYLNECIMKAESCSTNTTVGVKHQGACVVCRDTSCSGGKRCVPNKLNQPICQCPKDDDCPRDYDPVCGSDKRTYINPCRLKVEACVTGQPLVVDKKGICDPCKAARCLYHALCVNKSNGSTACECPSADDCPDVVDRVCSSNGVTFDSECKMKAYSCDDAMNVTVKHRGECGPCSFSDCQDYYGTCTVAPDGSGTAQCQCPKVEDCPSSVRELCGDDGKTYENRCRLEAESCRIKKRIEIKARGPCTPCSKVTCPKDHNCVVNAQGKAECECPKQCPSLGEAVCGSDGKTYENECKARQESCEKKKGLTIKRGSCGLVVIPCSLKSCTNNALCTFSSGSVACRCPDINDCSTVRNPVCGSDGTTQKLYDNLCSMEVESCKLGKTISPVPDEKCASCETVSCDNYATCMVQNDRPVCVCPSEKDCPWLVDLLCGSDGQSYINECIMRARSCKAGKRVTRKRSGYCGICDLVKCPGDSHCFLKQNGLHECRCPSEDECPSTGEKVCGSDGITYDNECKLKAAACRSGGGIVLKKEGSCDTCTGMKCQPNQVCEVVENKAVCRCPKVSDCGYNPATVCGSDGKEYSNECLLKARSCSAASGSGGLVVVNKGKCRGGCSLIKCSKYAVCHNSPDGTPTCVCPKKEDCPASVKPVCGSDGKTYINECLMEVIACEANEDTDKRKDGLCDPCKFVACTNNTKCEEQADGSTQCVCQSPEDCPDDVEPVCGSNRKTYDNECLFKVEACGTDMTFKQGRCDACSFHECKSYQDCVVNNNAAKCQCPRKCPSTNKPVCASNGRSYKSECYMRVKACKTKKDLVVVRKGNCDACSFKRCRLYENCIIGINNEARCVCPSLLQCLRGQSASPVCGSDGRTYSSECALRAENCAKRRRTLLQFSGKCGLVVLPCSSTSCRFGARCGFEKGYPECVCPLESDCPRQDKPVCGTDGQNYPNECVLKARACLMRKDVEAEYDGHCVACLLANCARFFARCEITQAGLAQCVCPSIDSCPLTRDEVCANDTRTYDTECHMRAQACEQRTPLTVVKKGLCETCEEKSCPFYGTCVTVDQQPECQCPTISNCSSKTDSVCGSDSKVYLNECYMKVSSCEAGQLITVKNKGVCDQDLSVGFKGDSYMMYKALTQVKVITDIVMEFRPISRTGRLFSSRASGRRRNNDFIEITLKRQRVIFSYNLGRGAVLIENNQRVRINQWNKLRAYRNGINGYLEVNGVRVNGSSKPGASQLNLDMEMYLGGAVDSKSKIAGFFGLIANLLINGERYGLMYPGVLSGHPLGQYRAVMNASYDLCMIKPCLHGGTCFVENEAKCRCLPGFLGSRCGQRANVPYFQAGTVQKDSYIKFQPLVLREDEFAASFLIRPEAATGLIMYSGLGEDFISLAMRGGKLEFRFNLGQGKVIISTNFNLVFNQWYHVEIIRVGLQGTLIINNDEYVFRGVAPGTWTNLNLKAAVVYLGGGTSFNGDLIFQRTGVAVGFRGCIREFETEKEDLRENLLDLSISKDQDSEREPHNVKKCGCKDVKCENKGSCIERPNDFRCDCPIGYTGPQCQIVACGKNIVFDVGFAIDGSNSIDDNEYRLTKDFVKDVIRIFTISEQSTHVALLEYASEASIKVYFDDDDYYQADKLLERVEQLTQAQGASTNIGRGLEKTLGMFSADYGMREKVTKLFIFFTDGKNTDRGEDLSPYSQRIKAKGIETISVGVGNGTDLNELRTIASSPNNVIQLEEFEQLKYIIEKLVPAECKGSK